MTDPIQILIAEHNTIKKVSSLFPHLQNLWINNPRKYEEIIREIIEFCRGYADFIHHHKEEEMLFPLLEMINPSLRHQIIEELLDHHHTFRQLINTAETLLNSGKYEESYNTLAKYFDLIESHIQAEDYELFVTATEILSPSRRENLSISFLSFDDSIKSEKERLEKLPENIMSKLTG